MKILVIVPAVIIAAGIGILFFWNPSAAPSSVEEEPVIVDSPKPGEAISSPLTVTGKARGTWYFEASFPMDITDEAGNILGQSHAQAQNDWMTTDYVRFSGIIEFTKQPPGSKGFLVVKKDNPSGLPEHDDSRQIPIVFK